MPYLLHKPDGSIAVHEIYDVPADDADAVARSITAAAALGGYTVVAVSEVTADQIPKDKTFRAAWRHCPENGVRHCMDTARNIHRDRMREKRKLLFSEVDAAFMRAQMQGLSTAEVAAEAQKLRDVTASPEIETVKTIEELKELWPTETLGETVYTEPPAETPAPEPYGWDGDGNPLWTKAEFDTYLAQFTAALGQQQPPEPLAAIESDEAEPAPAEQQTNLEEFLADAAPVPEPPLSLPRIYRDTAESPMAEAMRRVEEAEAFDAPLPEYVEPRDPVEQVFGPSDEQRLQAETDKATASLTSMRWRYDIAVRALNGNQDDIANLEAEAKRRRVPVETIADRIVIQWKKREAALSQIKDIEDATLDAILATPDVAGKIVDTAIAQIKKVHDAAAN
jgi:hypothetical protein